MLNFLHDTPILTGPIVFMTVRPSHMGGRNDTHDVTKSFFATVLPTTLLQYTANMLGDCAINLSSSKTSPIRNFLHHAIWYTVTCVSDKRVTFSFAMNYTDIYNHGLENLKSRGNESLAATRSGVFIDQLSHHQCPIKDCNTELKSADMAKP
jgi:hypothetical protein